MNAQNLWWDPNSKSIYAYGGGTTVAGGEGTDKVDPLSVWEFTPKNNTWTERYGPEDDLWNNMTRATRCASVYTPESGYCLGGYSGAWSTDVNTPSSDIPLGGMVEFDFETTTWSNISSVGSSQRGWTIGQQMEYVPLYGKKGILVAIGGHDLPDQGQYAHGVNLRSMSNITIYDINTKTWHSQNATGDIPSGRSMFCSVAVQGGNDDTFEMSVTRLVDVPFNRCMVHEIPGYESEIFGADKLLDLSLGATVVPATLIVIRYTFSHFRPSVGSERRLPRNPGICTPARWWEADSCSASVALMPSVRILSTLSAMV